MKTVKITADFDGYPNGTDKVTYRAGDEVTVSNEFADNITGKGLAKEVAGSTTSKASADDGGATAKDT